MKSLFLLGALTFVSSASYADVYREGKFYEIGAKTEGPYLFIQKIHRKEDKDGQTISVSTIEDAEGNVVMRETAVMKGDKILSQKMDQLQIDQSYELSSKENKIKFETFELKGEERKSTSHNEVDRTDRFITGPSVEPYLRTRVSKPGEVANSEFGIFELEKPIRFEFKNLGPAKDREAFQVTMSPKSFFLSLLVTEIKMEFSKEGFELVRFEGRTPVRRKVKDKWKPLDAVIIYETVKAPAR